METIHYSDYASQPDIRIACSQTWTTPKWGGAMTTTPEVYRGENDQCYTFTRSRVTCVACQRLMGTKS